MIDFFAKLFIAMIFSLAISTAGCQTQPDLENQPSQPRASPTIPVSSETIFLTPASTDSLVFPTSDVQPGNGEIPVQSLDGLIVAFSTNGELWIWSGGTVKLIRTHGPAHNPRISPDGELIVFLSPVDDYQIELWVIKVDGTGERRLAGAVELEPIGGATRDPNAIAIIPHRYEWLPGSHILAFNTEYAYQGPGTVLLDDFNLVDADTGKLTYTLLTGWGGEFFISPQGGQVAFSRPTEIILANLDGSDWRSVFTHPPVNPYSDYRYYAEPAWSPDGGSLLIALPPPDPLAEPVEPTRLILIDAASSSSTVIGEVISLPFFDTPVIFSQNLDKLAYFAAQAKPEDISRSLFVASVDGSATKLNFQAKMLQFMGWNFTGSRFSLAAGENQVVYIGAPGEEPVLLQPALPGIVKVSWIDADRFLYLSGIGEEYKFGLVDINGQAIIIASQVTSRLEFDFTWRR